MEYNNIFIDLANDIDYEIDFFTNEYNKLVNKEDYASQLTDCEREKFLGKARDNIIGLFNQKNVLHKQVGYISTNIMNSKLKKIHEH